jgi:hypothetical protein
MSDDLPISIAIDELTLYQANSCPAELLIPYNLSANQVRFTPYVFFKSKFKQTLFNMDSPLLMAISLIALLHLGAAFFLGILAGTGIVPACGAVASLVLAPMSLLFLTAPLYALIVICNLKISGGRDWRDRLLGPTNVGLTESGFKLWWQGAAFYNYPNLSLWSDIFFIDLKEDERSGDQAMHFIYQSGFGRRTIELPLRGFLDIEDARLVLDYFARNVIADYQSENFKAQAALGFEESLKKIACTSNPLRVLSEQEQEEYRKLDPDSSDSVC